MPVEGPRGEHGFYIVSDGAQPARCASSRARRRSSPCQALPKMIVGGLIADVIAVIGSTDVVMGDVIDDGRHREESERLSLSFHPSMDYGRGHHKSARALPEEGPAFAYTPENRATARGDLRAVSARAAQVGDSRRAVSRAASAGLPHAQRDAARGRGDRLHAGGRRGRRVVLHDVLHAAGRHATSCRSAARCRAR